MPGNILKGQSYSTAWARINKSMKEGYYFEAIAICESIISDRLLSYVIGTDSSCNLNEKSNFGKLIQRWRILTSGTLPMHGTIDLGDAVDTWRLERNTVIHGIAKSFPGTPTDPVQSFLNNAKSTAEDGVELTKAVQTWHRKQLNAHLNSAVTTTTATSS